MLQLQTILPDTLELLKCLSAQLEPQGMRLVGGTALALQHGSTTSGGALHRRLSPSTTSAAQ